MSLYPSLEDMKVDQIMKAQIQASQPPPTAPGFDPSLISSTPVSSLKYDALYPTLNDYMGLTLTSDELALIRASQNEVAISYHIANVGTTNMVAPISGSSLGLQRANVTHGIRELILCKDANGKVGMRVQTVNKGIFVVFVENNSPASMVGLRFGDQILQINGENVAGYNMDKVHSIIKKASINGIKMVVRDRPFERTVTLHKDSVGHVGFIFKNGKINGLVKDSSAARNGLLVDHHLLEVNGQNVVGMDDKDIRYLMEVGGNIITLTIMPSFVHEHMMKHMASNLVKKFMDHSVPDV